MNQHKNTVIQSELTRRYLGIPDFVCAQQFDYSSGFVYALRFNVAEDYTMTLEVKQEYIELTERTYDFESIVIDALLEHGSHFKDALTACDVQTARNDIARTTRRAGGNFVIIHESQRDAFVELFKSYKENGIILRTVKHLSMIGTLITTYKNFNEKKVGIANNIDGGLILAYDKHHRYNLITDQVAKYTRVLNFDRGLEHRLASIFNSEHKK